MSGDLTRWNRAGLTALNYVDGNAATYLEDLRQSLRTQFAGDEDVLRWLGDAPANNETLTKWQQRLLDQYRGDRRDYAWEMLRTFARAVHVLGGYGNAYSNERFIRTATQWDNVRRLVNMLDYHPAPPASAETYVALLAKTKDLAIGTVDAGLTLKTEPTDGSSPLTFETLANLDVDYRVNEFRARYYNRSQLNLSIPAQNNDFLFTPLTMPKKISIGDRGVLCNGTASVAIEIKQIDGAELTLTVIEHNFSGTIWSVADIQLQLAPAWQKAPQLNGSYVVELTQSNSSIVAGDVLAYQSSGYWYVCSVVAVSGTRVQLSASVGSGVSLYKTSSANVQSISGSSYFVLPTQRMTTTVWSASLTALSPTSAATVEGVVPYHYITANTTSKVFYLAQGTPVTATVASTTVEALRFDGKAGDLSSGDWILLQSSTSAWYSAQIATLTQADTNYTLTLENGISGLSWILAEGHFANSTPRNDYNQNTDPVYNSATTNNCHLTLELSELPDVLKSGRYIWVVGPVDAAVVQVSDIIDMSSTSVTVSVKPSLSGLDLPKYQTIIYGNVVRAGHGETRSEAVLGNGNRIEANQTFDYKKTGIAFVQDNNFSAGVRAAVQVRVDDRIWTQVDNLRDSAATDMHYEVRLTETGEITVRFGDGKNGQRLPTGTNNVRLQARFGNGTAGNLAAGSLSKLKKPHVLVDGVLQPSAATGGGEIESATSLRENAPASVLALDRAVSVADFAALAQRLASVWQAKSFALPDQPGATDRVEVVLVPAGGGDLGDLANSVTTYLQSCTRPGVQVIVSRYQALLLYLEITLRVDSSAYDPDLVAANVLSALVDAFSLENARLGAPLYLSRAFQVVEAVEGVENADVAINPGATFIDENGAAINAQDVFLASDGTVRRVTPSSRQVIYMNTALLAPYIKTEAFNG